MEMANNGKILKGNKMAKLFIRIFCMALVLTCAILTGCNSENVETATPISGFDNLKFIVNVSKGTTYTRSATGKNDWAVGDTIVVAIDDNDANLCNLEYQGDGNWNVTKLSNTNFSNLNGKLAAVHADKIKIDSNGITTEGDILYTKDGTYEKHDNVVVINLQMNQRPVSRIAVVGAGNSCWIDGLQTYDKLESITNMSWNNQHYADNQSYKEIYGDTCVFYGKLSETNGNTVITLNIDDSTSYQRTYTGKSVAAGDYIIIHGPLTNEKDLWSTNVSVTGILANYTSDLIITGYSGNTSELYTFLPSRPSNKNVTVVSTNPDVLSINDDGTYTAKSVGTSEITVKTEDGDYSCQSSVTIKNMEDVIAFNITGISTVVGSGVSYGRQFTISNKSDYDIEVVNLDNAFDDDDAFYIEAHKSKSVTLYYRVSGWLKNIKLVFRLNGRQYETAKQFEI